MKLYCSPASPFARKVIVCAMELGLADQIEQVTINPLENPPELIKVNPLCKVPALLTDDGELLFESPLLVTYLDELAVKQGKKSLTHDTEWDHIKVLTLQALADGVMESAFRLTMEAKRPQEQQSMMWQTRWTDAILHSLSHIIEHYKPLLNSINTGSIAVACTLEYIDFRQPQINWRESHAPLASWLAEFAQNDALRTTKPV